MLRLHLFGPPHIDSMAAPVHTFRSRKVEALLYYLAITPGQHRRLHLANLLWSEIPEETALGNLRYALWNLRQVIHKLPLHADRLTVTFQPTGPIAAPSTDQATDNIWVDVHEFQGFLSGAVSVSTAS